VKKKRSKLGGREIVPPPIAGGERLADLVDSTFLAYNAARLREGCRLFTERMLAPDVTVGLSLTGALTPAGLGMAALIPLIRAGFVDWVVSTGANLYHDTHFGIGLSMHQGQPNLDDVKLRRQGVVRIHDIVFDYDVLLETDAFFARMIEAREFQKTMSTAEFHHRAGKWVRECERVLGIENRSFLSAAYEAGVPVYTSSPGDSSIGMGVAAAALRGNRLRFDVNLDVNETAALVYGAKKGGGRSAVVILGGGSPKNFVLQTEPHIQEVLMLAEKGHDYFLQVTDARPDTGGLSGATPSEAVSWGKVDPEMLPHTVVCYLDSTVALPILTSYALSRHEPRPPRRLYDRRKPLLARLTADYLANRAAAGESCKTRED
jgi:deoxyhypusine synthase